LASQHHAQLSNAVLAHISHLLHSCAPPSKDVGWVSALFNGKCLWNFPHNWLQLRNPHHYWPTTTLIPIPSQLRSKCSPRLGYPRLTTAALWSVPGWTLSLNSIIQVTLLRGSTTNAFTPYSQMSVGLPTSSSFCIDSDRVNNKETHTRILMPVKLLSSTVPLAHLNPVPLHNAIRIENPHLHRSNTKVGQQSLTFCITANDLI
jgi:hypothetical protein